ncbi:MAG: TonB-dependent receptor [Muriicola sp.]|nr:TonB-dependent receptor [Muriicola sp.]
MQITRLKRFLFCFFIFFGVLANAQDGETNRVALIPYLQQLEQEYNIAFSYVDDDLKDLRVIPIDETELTIILQFLEKETQLRFDKLSERYFTITPITTVDICGFVFDNYGTNTIPGATVEVLGSSEAVLTDMDGKFTLGNIPRDANLRIRFLGFKPRYISASELIKNTDCPVLLLALSYQELEEVVVYQFLTTGISREKDGSILLDIEDFGILPGLSEPDILQTIQALPGIKSIDETVSDINIRGGTNDQNLILWDGIKMYQSGHFFGLISAFNPYLTDKVTIIKNGTSSQYGDGVSGIISMETKNEVQDRIFGGGGFNLISGDMYSHIPLSDRLAVQFSARRSVTDFLNTPTYNQFFERAFQDTEVKGSGGSDDAIDREENFYFYDFTAKVLYDINDYHKLRVSAIQINNNLDYVETNQTTSRVNQSLLDQTNFSFGGRLSSQWSDRFSTDLNAYYTRYNLDAQNIEGNGEQTLFQNNEVLESSLKATSAFVLTDELLTRNGYQLTEVGITNFTNVSQPPFMSNIKGVIRSHALFSEFQYKSSDEKFEFLGGARLNYLQNLGTFEEIILEPRLNLSYMLWPDFRLEFRGEFKNQTTNQIIDLEQNFLGIEKRRWILSDNSTLPITRSKQASLGINYDRNKWFIGLEGFYKEVTGVSTSTQGFQNEDQFDGEIGSYTIKGAEFLINYKNNKFSSWMSYAFNDNTYYFEDISPNEFPNNLDIRHTATVASTYNYRNLKLGLGLNYRTGKPYTKPVEGSNAINTFVFPSRINYQDPNSSRLPDYLRADASLIYDFSLGGRVKASAGVSVLNLLGKRNVLNIYYRLNDQDEIETVESISLGLTPNASFRLSF